MSFTFGTFDFTTLTEGNFALQREFPWVSGLSIESLEIPSMERRRFLETNRPATGIEFDMILHGNTEEELRETKKLVEIYLDPALGPQRLSTEVHPDWYWTATVSGEVGWERLYWNCHSGYAYRGTVAFESYNDAAQRRFDEDEGTPISSATPIDLEGNTRAWPTFEIRSTLGSNESVELVVTRGARPVFVVEVEGPLSSGQVMRLNYDEMQFAVWSGDTKVASLVDRMSTLDRLELRVLDNSTATIDFPGTGTAVVHPNSRRQ